MIEIIKETENWAELKVNGGELYLRRSLDSNWEFNFYERNQVDYSGCFLHTARLANRYFAGRKFDTPNEAAKAVVKFVRA